MGKFKVGDYVIVLNPADVDRDLYPRYVDEMIKYAGVVFMVSYSGTSVVHLKGTGRFMWNPKWLMKVEEFRNI